MPQGLPLEVATSPQFIVSSHCLEVQTTDGFPVPMVSGEANRGGQRIGDARSNNFAEIETQISIVTETGVYTIQGGSADDTPVGPRALGSNMSSTMDSPGAESPETSLRRPPSFAFQQLQ